MLARRVSASVGSRPAVNCDGTWPVAPPAPARQRRGLRLLRKPLQRGTAVAAGVKAQEVEIEPLRLHPTRVQPADLVGNGDPGRIGDWRKQRDERRKDQEGRNNIRDLKLLERGL